MGTGLWDLISLLYTDSTGNYSPPEPPRQKDAGPIGRLKIPAFSQDEPKASCAHCQSPVKVGREKKLEDM